jgi:hypothetical protein
MSSGIGFSLDHCGARTANFKTLSGFLAVSDQSLGEGRGLAFIAFAVDFSTRF